MKLTDVQIDGFGVWQRLELRELSSSCTVFYGANEAGKTTLLQFIRAALYGFSPARRLRYLPPVRGGDGGGTLVVSDNAEGTLRIVRRESPEEPLGSVTIEAADSTVQGDAHLHRLLHDVDETTFNNVFAVGLREIQELGTLTDGDAAQWLYAIAAGMDRVSLAEVLRDLEISRSRLIAQHDRPCQIGELLDQRDRLQRELAEVSTLPQRHAQLVAQREACETEIAQIENDLAAWESEHRSVEAAAVAFDAWHRREALNAQIAALTPPEQWPADALLRMNRLSAAIRKGRSHVRTLANERKQLGVELQRISLNEALYRQAPRIEALSEHEAWILSVEQELHDAEATVGRLADVQQAQQGRFASAAANSSVIPLSLGQRDWAALKVPAQRLSKARRRAKAAQQQLVQHRSAADSSGKQLEAALSARGQRNLTVAVEAAGNRVAQLRRRVQLDQRIEQLTHSQADLEVEIAGLLERQILPPWMLWTLGGVFILGVVLVLGGWFLPKSFTGSWGWPMIWLGLVAIGSAIAAKFTTERSVASQLEEARKQQDLAQSQAEKDTAERDELNHVLAKGNGPWTTQLAAAERELAQLEELLPLDSQRQSTEQAASNVEQLAAEAKHRYRGALRRWKAALSAVGLPEHLTPRQARQAAIAGRELGEVESHLSGAKVNLDQRRREFTAIAGRIEQIFLAAGIVPQSDQISERLRQLRHELAAQENCRQRRDALARRRRKLRRRQTAVQERIHRLRRRRKLLLRDCNVDDPAAFRRRAEESAKLASLIAERDAAHREIASLLIGIASEETIAALIVGKTAAQLETELTAATQRLADARHRQRHSFERRGQLTEQIRLLADDRRLAVKRFELGQVERRLSAALQRWQVLTLTQRLLHGVKDDYERNRQPETLREASEYLARLTHGRYRRVWTPLGENTLLVDDHDGNTLGVDLLSRGTREQLFLSLRLALVGLFARRGIELPMILDDVLVNFDADRADAAVGVLCNFAERGHPLLVFTCHEHIALLFKRRHADVRRLPDHAVGGLALPFEIDDELTFPPRRGKPRRTKMERRREREPIAAESPPISAAPPINVATVHSEASEQPLVMEASPPPARVEVRLVEPPQGPVPEAIPPLKPIPHPKPSKRTKRRRFDPPHRATIISPIRRRWAAEEFTGELDDHVNPYWLLDESLLGGGERHSWPEEPPSRDNDPDSLSHDVPLHDEAEESSFEVPEEAPLVRVVHASIGAPSLRLLTGDDDDSAPLVVETSDDDEGTDSGEKLA